MPIRDQYGSGKFGLSIEIFPPKTPAGDVALFESLDRLTTFRPGFVSCTYGAFGSTSKRTVELCVEIQRRYDITATSHFTPSSDPGLDATRIPSGIAILMSALVAVITSSMSRLALSSTALPR